MKQAFAVGCIRIPRQILVVDDDHDNALVLKMILEYDNFKVDMFVDPKKALSNFEPQKYILALIDLKMEGMNGFELYERLYEMDSKMKVCFMSGYEYSKALSKFRDKHCEIGPEYYLKKPLNIDRFVGTIRKMTALEPIM